MKTKNDNSFGDYFKEIVNSANNLKNHPDNLVSKIASNIIVSTNNLSKGLEGQKILMYMLGGLSVLLCTFLILFGIQMKEYREVISGKKETFVQSFFGPPVFFYVDGKGNVINYKDLKDEKDILEISNYRLKDTLENKKFLLEYAVETYDIKFTKTKDGKVEKWSINSDMVDELIDLAKRSNKNTTDANAFVDEYKKSLKDEINKQNKK